MASSASTLLPALSILLLCVGHSASFFLQDSPQLRQLLSRYGEEVNSTGAAGAGSSRSRRAIRWSDREEILQLHNKLRGGVYPTASNMEHMVRPSSSWTPTSSLLPSPPSFYPLHDLHLLFSLLLHLLLLYLLLPPFHYLLNLHLHLLLHNLTLHHLLLLLLPTPPATLPLPPRPSTPPPFPFPTTSPLSPTLLLLHCPFLPASTLT